MKLVVKSLTKKPTLFIILYYNNMCKFINNTIKKFSELDVCGVRLDALHSRIEHVFGRTFIGRWLALKNWTYSFDLLGDCFKAALIIHSLEAYLRYEWGGKFPRFLTTEEKRVIQSKICL